MELDAQQNLWLAGPRGLWRVNAKDDGPQQMGLAQGLNMGGFSALATMAKTKSTWWLLGEAWGCWILQPTGAVSMASPRHPAQMGSRRCFEAVRAKPCSIYKHLCN